MNTDNSRLLNKKRAAITKLLNDFKQKAGDDTESSYSHQINNSKTSVICNDDNIFIPTDPTSPYAFTINVTNNHKTNKNEILDDDQQVDFSLDPSLTFALTSLG